MAGDDVVCVDVVCEAGSDVQVALQGSEANVAAAIARLQADEELTVPADEARSSPTTLSLQGDGLPAVLRNGTHHLCAVASTCDNPTSDPDRDWLIYQHKGCQSCPAGRFQNGRGQSECK